jgi:putative NIF3 family GTP cyclohydrolase 1 type 2
MLVNDLITLLLERSDRRVEQTVDTLKSGRPDQPVTGIVTTFLATVAVIERAAALGANVIVTHEPTFYFHTDDLAWLDADPVVKAKKALLDRHGIAVFRFHDHIHMEQPDGILRPVMDQLGWTPYLDPEREHIANLPPLTLGDLCAHLKQRLGARQVRVLGPRDLICRRVGVMVGAIGGQAHLQVLSRDAVDVLVCGEINEWDTSEYVRDALALGQHRAVIVVGHALSEEAGMAALADWLRQRLPGLPITHVPAGDPIEVM